MASLTKLTPSSIEPNVLTEGAEHRQALHPFYNQYLRPGAHAAASADEEGWQSLFRPLGLTGYLLADFVFSSAVWEAGRVLLASASSKTATATAHFLKQHGGVEVVGLTSTKHLDYVSRSGCYDRAESYDSIEAVEVLPTVYIDMAGDVSVTSRVHQRLHPALRKSILVGGTHWDATGAPQELPGPAPELFFVPAYLEQRRADWGPAELKRRTAEAWQSLMPVVQSSLKLVFSEGEAAVESAYRILLDGAARPDHGILLRL